MNIDHLKHHIDELPIKETAIVASEYLLVVCGVLVGGLSVLSETLSALFIYVAGRLNGKEESLESLLRLEGIGLTRAAIQSVKRIEPAEVEYRFDSKGKELPLTEDTLDADHSATVDDGERTSGGGETS